MKTNQSQQTLRIIAAILSALLVGNAIYYQCITIDETYLYSSIYTFLNFVPILFFILIFIGIVTKKYFLSIVGDSLFYTTNIIYFFLSWKYFFSGYFDTSLILLSFSQILCFFIAIILLLFLLDKVNKKISVILVSVLFMLQLIISWIYLYSVYKNIYFHDDLTKKLLSQIFSFSTLVSFITLIVVILSMILYSSSKPRESQTNKQIVDASNDSSNIKFRYKNIALYIILSFITCGLFLIVWIAEIIDDVHKLHEDNNSSIGELLLILFIPFYSWYWMYTRGKQIYQDSVRLEGNLSDNSILYLVLSILGLQIIAYALIQNDFNKFVTTNSNDRL